MKIPKKEIKQVMKAGLRKNANLYKSIASTQTIRLEVIRIIIEGFKEFCLKENDVRRINAFTFIKMFEIECAIDGLTDKTAKKRMYEFIEKLEQSDIELAKRK